MENSKMTYKFGPFVLNLSERLLQREEEIVGLGNKEFEILTLFVENAGHLFSKDELMRRGWPGVIVGEMTMAGVISNLREALGDDKKTYILTVIKTGYRFICPVEILQDGDLIAPSVALPAAGRMVHRLPEYQNGLIGRSREMAEIESLAESARVITLVGEGGLGKTRLAIEMGVRWQGQGKRVVFVSLADISDNDLILGEIASVLDVARSNPELPQTVALALSRRPTVLILDNFEQVVDNGATVVKELIQYSRGLVCLVTSRRRLRIAEESWYQLSPLALPGKAAELDRLHEVESVRLFEERARSANPRFKLTADNAGQVAAICEWLEGSPLAIELAALRMDEFSPAEILDNLERLLTLLVSEQRDAIPRHRSLQVAIEWSYRLLPPELQQLFTRLSVFRGGCDAEGVETVCQAPAARNALNRLVDHSLLKRERIGGNRKFRMIEVYREFGDEKLSMEESLSITRKHADYYFNLAEQASQKLLGAEQNAWLDRLEAEHDNLRAALDYYGHQESTESEELKLAVFLSRFWDIRGYRSEGRAKLQRALKRQQPGASSLIANGLAWLGLLSYKQDDYQCAEQLLSESLTMSQGVGDQECQAFSLSALGLVAEAQGNYREAKALFIASLESSQEANADWLIGWAFSELGIVAEQEGDLGSATKFYLKSLSKREEIQDLRGIAASLNCLGGIARREGDYSQARLYHEKSLALRQSMGNKGAIAICYFKLGLLEEAVGQHQASCHYFQKCLSLRCELGDRGGMARAMEGIARIAGTISNGEDAARIFGAAEALRLHLAVSLSPAEQQHYGQFIFSVKERFPSEWSGGSKWSTDEAIAYALSFNTEA